MKRKSGLLTCLGLSLGISALLLTAFMPQTTFAKSIGWTRENGGWKYYGNNMKPYTGWHWMTGKEGEKTPHWSYFGFDGFITTGWKWLTVADGEKTPHWSYFGGNGWLRTGWQWMDKTQGEKTPHWSYFGGNGWLRTGWQWMDKSQGEKTPHWSYFGGNGWLRTGMQTMGTKANPDGGNKQHLSYFGDKGWLVENKAFISNGKTYWADEKGWDSIYKDGKYLIGNGRKTIFIGDSRTDMAYHYMYDESNELLFDYDKGIQRWYENYSWVWNSNKGIERWYALFGVGYSNRDNWLSKAINDAEKYLDGSTDVVFLLGYNDLGNYDKYTELINKKADLWAKKGVKTYFVSVNPSTDKSKNNSVEYFNNYVKKHLKADVGYIDTYNNIVFNFENDGVHYKADTSKAMINYVMTHKN